MRTTITDRITLADARRLAADWRATGILTEDWADRPDTITVHGVALTAEWGCTVGILAAGAMTLERSHVMLTRPGWVGVDTTSLFAIDTRDAITDDNLSGVVLFTDADIDAWVVRLVLAEQTYREEVAARDAREEDARARLAELQAALPALQGTGTPAWDALQRLKDAARRAVERGILTEEQVAEYTQHPFAVQR